MPHARAWSMVASTSSIINAGDPADVFQQQEFGLMMLNNPHNVIKQLTILSESKSLHVFLKR
jgi:hypothetical protein